MGTSEGVREMSDDEKIARWAGFRFCKAFQGWKDRWAPPGVGIDDVWNHVGAFPDFTDPTALFRWCVPKLDSWEMGDHEHGVYAEVFLSAQFPQPYHSKPTRIVKATPGEALRAAILSSLLGRGDNDPT
jgi:hypothetical protein